MHKHSPGKNTPESGSTIHEKRLFSVQCQIIARSLICLIISTLSDYAMADSDWQGNCSSNWLDGQSCGGSDVTSDEIEPFNNWNPVGVLPHDVPTSTTPQVTISNGGSVNILGGNASGGQSLTISNGSTVNLGNSNNLQDNSTLSGVVENIFGGIDIETGTQISTFTQFGTTTHTVTNTLTIGNFGNYNLNGGTFNALNIINDGGTFTQAGGTISGTDPTGTTFINNALFAYSDGTFAGRLINNDTATFNPSLLASFDANISGSGSMFKGSNGTLILTGDNSSYSGTTTVLAGVLQGNTTSLHGNIINDASVVFDQTGTGTYADVMSGTGSLTKQGFGTLILTGDNNYSGGTNLNGGTLSAGLDSSLGALGAAPGPLTFNGGILQVTGTSFTSTPRTLNWGAAGGGFDIAEASNVFTVGQSLAGTGSLIKQGNGKLILTGDNDYSGGTTVSDGVLQGNTDSLQGNITNNASVVFDQTGTGTYADVMSGTGSLTKQGVGTLILTGDNGYSGGTTVSDGVLQGNTDSLQGNITNDASVVFD
ncbi:MAG: autotransporter-associated beta strand repeat-containing protein, partial [Methylococcales bacterium]|nr:autotransporter-associated beta strand repeat-containing protein [Methylococcales bacterium]